MVATALMTVVPGLGIKEGGVHVFLRTKPYMSPSFDSVSGLHRRLTRILHKLIYVGAGDEETVLVTEGHIREMSHRSYRVRGVTNCKFCRGLNHCSERLSVGAEVFQCRKIWAKAD